MSTAKIHFTPELLADLKFLVEETDTPMHEIAKLLGISRTTLRDRVREHRLKRKLPVRGNPAMVEALRARAASKTAAQKTQPPNAQDQLLAGRSRATAERIMTILESELAGIEKSFRDSGAPGAAEFDNRIRTLMGITRTLREIDLMNNQSQTAPSDRDDDDFAPRSIDEFREALARRIEEFAEAQRSGAGETDGEAV